MEQKEPSVLSPEEGFTFGGLEGRREERVWRRGRGFWVSALPPTTHNHHEPPAGRSEQRCVTAGLVVSDCVLVYFQNG